MLGFLLNRERSVHYLESIVRMSPGLSLGTTVGSRFIIERVLGAGGSGTVYLAQDPVLVRQVAVKIVELGSETSSKRFERECKVLSEINSSRIPQVYVWGNHDERSQFIVMEFIEGQTLEQVLMKGPLSVSELTTIFIQICEGLTHVHAKGIVHRDVKPGNIMISKVDGVVDVKVMDFGLVHMTQADMTLTNSQSVVGSFGYLSPEHLTPALLDARSDVFSLGCCLYRALAGHPPADSDFALTTIRRLKEGDYERLPDSVPAHLANTVYRCLAPEPEDRFQSAEDLRTCLAGEVTLQIPVRLRPAAHSRVNEFRPALLALVVLVLAGALVMCLMLCNQAVPSGPQAPVQFKVSDLRQSIRMANDAAAERLKNAQQKETTLAESDAVTKADLTGIHTVLNRQTDAWIGKRLRQNDLLSTLLEAMQLGVTAHDVPLVHRVDKIINCYVDSSGLSGAKILAAKVTCVKLAYYGDPARCANESFMQRLRSLLTQVLKNPSQTRLILDLMGTCEVTRGHAESALNYFVQTFNLPREAKEDRVDDIKLVCRFLSYNLKKSSSLRKQLLLSRLAAVQELVLGNQLGRDDAEVFILAFREIPYEDRRTETKELIELFRSPYFEDARYPEWIAIFVLLRGRLEYDLSKTVGLKTIDEVFKHCDLAVQDRSMRFRRLVAVLSMELEFSRERVADILVANPKAWADDLFSTQILRGAYQKNSAMLEYLFNRLQEPSNKGTSLRSSIGVVLAASLAQQKRSSEARRVIEAIEEGSGYSEEFSQCVCFALAPKDRDSAALKSMYERMCQSKKAPAASKVIVGSVLADMLSREGRKDEACRVLDSIETHVDLYSNDDFQRVCNATVTVGEPKRLERLVTVLLPRSHVSDLKRAEIISDVASSLARQKRYDTCDSMIDLMKKIAGWQSDHVARNLLSICNEKFDALGAIWLFKEIWNNPNVSKQTQVAIGAELAGLIDLQDKKEADRVFALIRASKEWKKLEAAVMLCRFLGTRRDYAGLLSLSAEIGADPLVDSETKMQIDLEVAGNLCVPRLDKTVRSLVSKAKSSSGFKGSLEAVKRFARICLFREDSAGIREAMALFATGPFSASERLCGVAEMVKYMSSIGQFEDVKSVVKDILVDPHWVKYPDAVAIILDTYYMEGNIDYLQRVFDAPVPIDKELCARRLLLLLTKRRTKQDDAHADAVIDWLKRTSSWSKNPATVDALRFAYCERCDVAALKDLPNGLAAAEGQRIVVASSLASCMCQKGDRSGATRVTANQFDFIMHSPQFRNLIAYPQKTYAGMGDLSEARHIGELAAGFSHYSRRQGTLALGEYYQRNNMQEDLNKVAKELLDMDLEWFFACEFASWLDDIAHLKKLYQTWCVSGAYHRTRLEVGMRLANAFDAAGRKREADKLISELRELPGWSGSPSVIVGLAQLYGRRKDAAKMQLLLEQSEEMKFVDERPLVRARAANMYSELGANAEADKLLRMLDETTNIPFGYTVDYLQAIYTRRRDKAKLRALFLRSGQWCVLDMLCTHGKIGLDLAALLRKDEPLEARKILQEVSGQLARFEIVSPRAASIRKQAIEQEQELVR